jgi:hypothetical protein
MVTVPAHSLFAPVRACVMAAARFMPGVYGVLGSSWSARIIFTPCSRQSTFGTLLAMVHYFACGLRRKGPSRGRRRISPQGVWLPSSTLPSPHLYDVCRAARPHLASAAFRPARLRQRHRKPRRCGNRKGCPRKSPKSAIPYRSSWLPPSHSSSLHSYS